MRMKSTFGESPFGVLQGVFFGLLALLLAFSFSLGLSRYDARRVRFSRRPTRSVQHFFAPNCSMLGRRR
jgi:hypothetical protein